MKKLFIIVCFLLSGLYTYGQGDGNKGHGGGFDLRNINIHPNERQLRSDRHDNLHRSIDRRHEMSQIRSVNQGKDRNVIRQRRIMEVRHERVLQRQRH